MKSIENKIYIDPPFQYMKKRERFSHMISDNTEYLHEFAKKIGLKRFRFENKYHKNQPHYDVPENFYKAAIEAGAVLVPRKKLLSLLKAFHEINKLAAKIESILYIKKENR